MTIQYTNRKQQTFYLHQGTTKTGKPKYFFSLKPQGEAVARIPEGFEIYEDPDARVTLRRKLPRLITDEEVAIVEQAIKRYTKLEHYKIDVKKETLTIYTEDQDTGLLDDLFGLLPKDKVNELLYRFATLTPMLRFVLRDPVKREFATERFCFSGSIDDWIEIGETGTVKALAKTYIKHLGKESFFDLM